VGESQLVVVLHGRTNVQPDDVIGLVIKTDKVHLFDGVTERRI
jgi:multiple sugar transport system ATP-binding protein